MKIIVSFISFFSIQSFATTNEDLVTFWMNLRFQNCDQLFAMQLSQQNILTLSSLNKTTCNNIDLNNTTENNTLNCFKQLDKNLQISLEKSKIKAADFNCKANSGYLSYIDGNKSNLKPTEKIFDAAVVCIPDDGKNFTYASVEGKRTCFKKFNCNNKFKFGSATLDHGTYVLRCHDNASSQVECDQVSLGNCAGTELSYSKLEYFGLSKTSPTAVRPSQVSGGTNN